jgi:hypothetical protein
VADQKASTESTVLPGTDTLRLIGSDSAVDGVATGAGIARAFGMRKFCNIATQGISAATLTHIVGSDIVVPAGQLIQVRTMFQWQVWLTKTAAGTAARTFHVRLGLGSGGVGATGDTLIASFTSAAGTAAADNAYIEIAAICFSIASNLATFESSFMLSHNLASTGFSTTSNQIVTPATSSATRDISVAGLIASLSVTSGTSEALTIRQVIAQAFNL